MDGIQFRDKAGVGSTISFAASEGSGMIQPGVKALVPLKNPSFWGQFSVLGTRIAAGEDEEYLDEWTQDAGFLRTYSRDRCFGSRRDTGARRSSPDLGL